MVHAYVQFRGYVGSLVDRNATDVDVGVEGAATLKGRGGGREQQHRTSESYRRRGAYGAVVPEANAPQGGGAADSTGSKSEAAVEGVLAVVHPHIKSGGDAGQEGEGNKSGGKAVHGIVVG